MTSDSGDLRTVTVTGVIYEQGRVVLFAGESLVGRVEFYVHRLSAAPILEALKAGETPVANVPYWSILGCPEWCMYDDLHDEEKRVRVEAEAPVVEVTCEGYGADPRTLLDWDGDQPNERR